MLKYSLVKVIPEDVVRPQVFLNLKGVSVCSLSLIICIQILIYQNFDILVMTVAVLGVLLFFT